MRGDPILNVRRHCQQICQCTEAGINSCVNVPSNVHASQVSNKTLERPAPVKMYRGLFWGVEGWHPLFRNFATVGKFADMSQLLLACTWLSCIKTYPTNVLVGQNQLGVPNIYCSST